MSGPPRNPPGQLGTPGREWRTEGEIRSISREEAEDVVDDQMKLLRNGAQAALNIDSLLIGAPQYGQEGFIAKVDRRLEALETASSTRTGQYEEIVKRLDRVESRQQWMVKALKAIWVAVRWVGAHLDLRWVTVAVVSLLLSQSYIPAAVRKLGGWLLSALHHGK